MFATTGQEERLTGAFASFGDELVRALASLLGDADDARDVAQETFLKCWRSRDRVAEVRDLKAWIFRVGLNSARDLRRNAWRKRARPLLDAFADPSPAADDAAQFAETLRRHADALGRLPPEQRDVYLLRHRDGLTYDQVARALRTPLGTVKTRMRAALAVLRHELA